MRALLVSCDFGSLRVRDLPVDDKAWGLFDRIEDHNLIAVNLSTLGWRNYVSNALKDLGHRNLRGQDSELLQSGGHIQRS